MRFKDDGSKREQNKKEAGKGKLICSNRCV